MIVASSLRKHFGAVQALDEVSFTAADGRITGLLGHNGAGKSTTLRILSTVMHADSGSACVDGHDCATRSLEVRQSLGVLPHSNVFGSPIVMFEMMGLSIPLVLPRLRPIEDVHRDGETALTFPPLDFAACRAAIARYLADRTLRELLAARARDLLISRHTWRDTASRILAALPPGAS